MAEDASPSSSSDPPDSVASSDDPIERFLRKVDISTISDVSSDGAALTRSRICALCECRLRGTFIFLPSAPGHLLWDVLVGLMIVYYLCMVPMRLAFEPHNPDSDLIAGKGIFLGIDILFDVLFMVDIWVNFRTAYFDKGELEVQPRRIFWRYFKGWFTLDLVASLPTTIITTFAAGSSAGVGSECLWTVHF